MGFPIGSAAKESSCSAGATGDQVLFQGQEDPLEESMQPALVQPCLENPMNRGAWRATICGVAKSWILGL